MYIKVLMEQLFLTGHMFDHLTTQTANIVFKMTLFIVIKNVLKDGLFSKYCMLLLFILHFLRKTTLRVLYTTFTSQF